MGLHGFLTPPSPSHLTTLRNMMSSANLIDFDVPRVLGWNVDVHVHEKDVPSGARSCLARDPRCHVLSGCSSCLHPTTSCARSPVVSQHVEKSLASFARCLHDLKWQLQSIEQKRPEELMWNGELWCGRPTRHRDACFCSEKPPRREALRVHPIWVEFFTQNTFIQVRDSKLFSSQNGFIPPKVFIQKRFHPKTASPKKIL